MKEGSCGPRKAGGTGTEEKGGGSSKEIREDSADKGEKTKEIGKKNGYIKGAQDSGVKGFKNWKEKNSFLEDPGKQGKKGIRESSTQPKAVLSKGKNVAQHPEPLCNREDFSIQGGEKKGGEGSKSEEPGIGEKELQGGGGQPSQTSWENGILKQKTRTTWPRGVGENHLSKTKRGKKI